jgi:hypothetical protein
MLSKFFIRALLQCALLSIAVGAQSVPVPANPSNTEPQQPPVNHTVAERASLFGTVLDKSQMLVPNAHIHIDSLDDQMMADTHSGDDGTFKFTDIAPGHYKLTITAAGMGFYTQQIELKRGEDNIISGIVLPVATQLSEVHVYADKNEIAKEELHIAEKQRVFGVIPNFYVVYDWNAPALSSKQKYHLVMRASLDPVQFLGTGIIAGFQQASNTYPTYGQGMEGYGKRYGAEFATDSIATFFGGAVYPQLFHQDPRYFYKGTGSKKSRIWYAIQESVMCRGDNGKLQFDFSGILGSLTAGAISNLYYPPSERGFSLTLLGTIEGTAGTAAGNIIQEFFIKRFTTHSKDKAPAAQ